MSRHEAHITFELKDAEKVEELSAEFPHWKFSKIHGCPLMGPDKTYCYLTGYHEDGKQLRERVDAVVFLAYKKGARSIREKIERIVYDSKTGVNEL